ncbi:uncharacterized protein B0H18DRAFT_999830 [Fomitopsis serialis]|uniref:uncharacterized protein n=1 Tax=Fomitopsis serialis TaxID=139415 RepID=UPI002007D55D|nr:uncharacterized protein B0H18DRAFT_999830 [Neoantrodia serialis]KAH9928637.1 hypothetical protein B0H18DRAFT_999830 [Neoantrodia serialis]
MDSMPFSSVPFLLLITMCTMPLLNTVLIACPLLTHLTYRLSYYPPSRTECRSGWRISNAYNRRNGPSRPT